MSTKKKDNTTGEMILEKKETQADIQARMETGKIEIMKVVEGIPGAEKLAELIERGKKKGKLSSSELLDVLEDMELGTDQMDKIYDTLENLGIDTVGEDSRGAKRLVYSDDGLIYYTEDHYETFTLLYGEEAP